MWVHTHFGLLWQHHKIITNALPVNISSLLELAEKRKTTRLKVEMARLKECRDDEVWRKVMEGDGTMWQRFDEEEKCWRVWGRWKTGVIRQWRTQPQLMCWALVCGTRCPLISGIGRQWGWRRTKQGCIGFSRLQTGVLLKRKSSLYTEIWR